MASSSSKRTRQSCRAESFEGLDAGTGITFSETPRRDRILITVRNGGQCMSCALDNYAWAEIHSSYSFDLVVEEREPLIEAVEEAHKTMQEQETASI